MPSEEYSSLFVSSIFSQNDPLGVTMHLFPLLRRLLFLHWQLIVALMYPWSWVDKSVDSRNAVGEQNNVLLVHMSETHSDPLLLEW